MYILNENVRFYGKSIRIFMWHIWLFVIRRSLMASLFWWWTSSVSRWFSVFVISTLVSRGIIIIVLTVVLLFVFVVSWILHFSRSPCFHTNFFTSVLTFYQCFQNFCCSYCWRGFYFQNKTIFYYVIFNLYLGFLNIIKYF